MLAAMIEFVNRRFVVVGVLAGLLLLGVGAAGAQARQIAGAKPVQTGAVEVAQAGGVCEVGGPDWVQIPGGTFLMGSKGMEPDEKPVHQVTVAPFEMARTEVTVAQYRRCVEAGACSQPHWDDNNCYIWNGSSWVQGVLPQSFRGDNQPVVCVNWNQAAAYSKWAGGRLPTEAEWEYAARAGTLGDRYDVLDWVAWYDKNSGGQTHPAGMKQANKYGLSDMLGNVWEWCQDWYHDSYDGAPVDGSAWEIPKGSVRVGRGGAWGFSARRIRVTDRSRDIPDHLIDVLGFRPVRTVR